MIIRLVQWKFYQWDWWGRDRRVRWVVLRFLWMLLLRLLDWITIWYLQPDNCGRPLHHWHLQVSLSRFSLESWSHISTTHITRVILYTLELVKKNWITMSFYHASYTYTSIFISEFCLITMMFFDHTICGLFFYLLSFHIFCMYSPLWKMKYIWYN